MSEVPLCRFRRREGAETTYYDVPLMRGSPEYFESLRATQPLQVRAGVYLRSVDVTV
jgi:hypothetical protein